MSTYYYRKCDICGKDAPKPTRWDQPLNDPFGTIYITKPGSDGTDLAMQRRIDICPECYEKLPDYLKNCVKDKVTIIDRDPDSFLPEFMQRMDLENVQS